MSIQNVKSVCDSLEISPCGKSSPILHGAHGGGGSTFKQTKGGTPGKETKK